MDEIPKIAAKRPCMRARVRGGKRSAITVNTFAMRMPAKRPWSARNRTSWSMSWDRPQSADAPTNPIMPARMNGFRPKRSPSFPAIGTMTVDETRYAVVTQA